MPAARELAEELLYPLRAPATLTTLALFVIFFSLVLAAGQISVILGVAATLSVGLAILPAIMRFCLQHLDARAEGRDTDALDARHFSWMENLWGVFPLVLLGGLGFLLNRLQDMPAAQIGIGVFGVALLPASMIVLAMTHSPLQSLNPFALARLIVRLRTSYWVAPVIGVLLIGLVLFAGQYSFWLSGVVAMYALLAGFGVLGLLIRPLDIAEETDIPMMETPVQTAIPEAQRLAALNLAYSFMSRGGTDNGIKHIEQSIRDEGADLHAWPWYFERMTRWENPLYALRFGQRAIHELLAANEQVAAAKLILRCRMLDASFRPLKEDLDAAEAALRATNNIEEADAIRR